MAGKVLVVNMIPRALSGETNQDSEPMLAVNPRNPDQIVGTSFTPDPMGGDTAPIYISTDGGNTWTLNSIVPSQMGVANTGDITVAFGPKTSNLYAGILRFPAPGNDTRLNVLRTTNFRGPAKMKVLVDRLGADQPFIQASATATSDRVYVGDNDFKLNPGKTSNVDFSLNPAVAAAKFKAASLESRGSVGQNGPQVRPACHADGTVYVAYYGWRKQSGSWPQNTLMITADVVVARDDNGGAGAKPFSSLTGTDGKAGKIVASGVKFPFRRNGKPEEGQQRLGGDLSIAVDPRDGKTVYLAYTGIDGGVYTLHLGRSLDSGQTWATGLLCVPKANNCALAINSEDVVGLLYQQLAGSGAAARWVTRFRRTTDGTGKNWDDLILSTAPANDPPAQFDPYLGDYDYLTSVGKDFYGIFSANNTPDHANFPNSVTYQRNADFTAKKLLDLTGNPVAISIDPFFFKVGV